MSSAPPSQGLGAGGGSGGLQLPLARGMLQPSSEVEASGGSDGASSGVSIPSAREDDDVTISPGEEDAHSGGVVSGSGGEDQPALHSEVEGTVSISETATETEFEDHTNLVDPGKQDNTPARPKILINLTAEENDDIERITAMELPQLPAIDSQDRQLDHVDEQSPRSGKTGSASARPSLPSISKQNSDSTPQQFSRSSLRMNAFGAADAGMLEEGGEEIHFGGDGGDFFGGEEEGEAATPPSLPVLVGDEAEKAEGAATSPIPIIAVGDASISEEHVVDARQTTRSGTEDKPPNVFNGVRFAEDRETSVQLEDDSASSTGGKSSNKEQGMNKITSSAAKNSNSSPPSPSNKSIIIKRAQEELEKVSSGSYAPSRKTPDADLPAPVDRFVDRAKMTVSVSGSVYDGERELSSQISGVVRDSDSNGTRVGIDEFHEARKLRDAAKLRSREEREKRENRMRDYYKTGSQELMSLKQQEQEERGSHPLPGDDDFEHTPSSDARTNVADEDESSSVGSQIHAHPYANEEEEEDRRMDEEFRFIEDGVDAALIKHNQKLAAIWYYLFFLVSFILTARTFGTGMWLSEHLFPALPLGTFRGLERGEYLFTVSIRNVSPEFKHWVAENNWATVEDAHTAAAEDKRLGGSGDYHVAHVDTDDKGVDAAKERSFNVKERLRQYQKWERLHGPALKQQHDAQAAEMLSAAFQPELTGRAALSPAGYQGPPVIRRNLVGADKPLPPASKPTEVPRGAVGADTITIVPPSVSVTTGGGGHGDQGNMAGGVVSSSKGNEQGDRPAATPSSPSPAPSTQTNVVPPVQHRISRVSNGQDQPYLDGRDHADWLRGSSEYDLHHLDRRYSDVSLRPSDLADEIERTLAASTDPDATIPAREEHKDNEDDNDSPDSGGYINEDHHDQPPERKVPAGNRPVGPVVPPRSSASSSPPSQGDHRHPPNPSPTAAPDAPVIMQPRAPPQQESRTPNLPVAPPPATGNAQPQGPPQGSNAGAGIAIHIYNGPQQPQPVVPQLPAPNPAPTPGGRPGPVLQPGRSAGSSSTVQMDISDDRVVPMSAPLFLQMDEEDEYLLPSSRRSNSKSYNMQVEIENGINARRRTSSSAKMLRREGDDDDFIEDFTHKNKKKHDEHRVVLSTSSTSSKNLQLEEHHLHPKRSLNPRAVLSFLQNKVLQPGVGMARIMGGTLYKVLLEPPKYEWKRVSHSHSRRSRDEGAASSSVLQLGRSGGSNIIEEVEGSDNADGGSSSENPTARTSLTDKTQAHASSTTVEQVGQATSSSRSTTAASSLPTLLAASLFQRDDHGHNDQLENFWEAKMKDIKSIKLRCHMRTVLDREGDSSFLEQDSSFSGPGGQAASSSTLDVTRQQQQGQPQPQQVPPAAPVTATAQARPQPQAGPLEHEHDLTLTIAGAPRPHTEAFDFGCMVSTFLMPGEEEGSETVSAAPQAEDEPQAHDGAPNAQPTTAVGGGQTSTTLNIPPAISQIPVGVRSSASALIQLVWGAVRKETEEVRGNAQMQLLQLPGATSTGNAPGAQAQAGGLVFGAVVSGASTNSQQVVSGAAVGNLVRGQQQVNPSSSTRPRATSSTPPPPEQSRSWDQVWRVAVGDDPEMHDVRNEKPDIFHSTIRELRTTSSAGTIIKGRTTSGSAASFLSTTSSSSSSTSAGAPQHPKDKVTTKSAELDVQKLARKSLLQLSATLEQAAKTFHRVRDLSQPAGDIVMRSDHAVEEKLESSWDSYKKIFSDLFLLPTTTSPSSRGETVSSEDRGQYRGEGDQYSTAAVPKIQEEQHRDITHLPISSSFLEEHETPSAGNEERRPVRGVEDLDELGVEEEDSTDLEEDYSAPFRDQDRMFTFLQVDQVVSASPSKAVQQVSSSAAFGAPAQDPLGTVGTSVSADVIVPQSQSHELQHPIEVAQPKKQQQVLEEPMATSTSSSSVQLVVSSPPSPTPSSPTPPPSKKPVKVEEKVVIEKPSETDRAWGWYIGEELIAVCEGASEPLECGHHVAAFGHTPVWIFASGAQDMNANTNNPPKRPKHIAALKEAFPSQLHLGEAIEIYTAVPAVALVKTIGIFSVIVYGLLFFAYIGYLITICWCFYPCRTFYRIEKGEPSSTPVRGSSNRRNNSTSPVTTTPLVVPPSPTTLKVNAISAMLMNAVLKTQAGLNMFSVVPKLIAHLPFLTGEYGTLLDEEPWYLGLAAVFAHLAFVSVSMTCFLLATTKFDIARKHEEERLTLMLAARGSAGGSNDNSAGQRREEKRSSSSYQRGSSSRQTKKGEQDRRSSRSSRHSFRRSSADGRETRIPPDYAMAKNIRISIPTSEGKKTTLVSSAGSGSPKSRRTKTMCSGASESTGSQQGQKRKTSNTNKTENLVVNLQHENSSRATRTTRTSTMVVPGAAPLPEPEDPSSRSTRKSNTTASRVFRRELENSEKNGNKKELNEFTV
ncbi:unnamed protein product [Amoebophrya sp. A25]|nr:unnamed protein product [Amoebophrya sp. A25]|eukprot:GSA25T00002738001.1